MAQIRSSDETLVICARSSVFLFPKSELLARDHLQVKPKAMLRLEDLKEQLPLSAQSNDDGDGNASGSIQFVNCAFSRRGDLFAVVTAQKLLLIFDKEFVLKRVHRLSKAPTAVVFDKTAEFAIVSDRSGAVSRFPAFVIQSFGLGHSEYLKTVTCCSQYAYTGGKRFEVISTSSGGDHQVRKWKIEDGSCVAISPQLHPEKGIRKAQEQVLAVLLEESSTIEFLSNDLEVKTTLSGSSENFVDIHSDDSGVLLALNKSSITVFDLLSESSRVVELNETVTNELASTADLLPQLFKNVTFNNADDYQRRKEERKRKLEAAKEERTKRKLNDTNST